MKTFTASRRLAAIAALVLFLAVPALAKPNSERGEPREPAIIRIIKAAKRILGISTTGDFPTVPKP